MVLMILVEAQPSPEAPAPWCAEPVWPSAELEELDSLDFDEEEVLWPPWATTDPWTLPRWAAPPATEAPPALAPWTPPALEAPLELLLDVFVVVVVVVVVVLEVS